MTASRREGKRQHHIREFGGLVAALAATTVGLVMLAPTPAQAALVDPVSCTSDISLFNTGHNAATGGALTSGNEPSWELASGTKWAPAGSLNDNPPTLSDAAAYTTPVVGNLAPWAWKPSPYNNANWIGSTAIPSQRYMYYRLTFDLADDVNPAAFVLGTNVMVDDQLVGAWVNGTSLGTPAALGALWANWNSPTALPAMDGHWQSGHNEIVIAVWNVSPPSGLLVQTSRNALLCAPMLSVTKTGPSTAKKGDRVTHTIAVTNTAEYTIARDVLVIDDAAGGDLDPVSWTCAASGTVTCPAPSGTGALNETVPTLAGAKGTLTYTVVSTVLADAGATVKNTARVSTPAKDACATDVTAKDDGCEASASLTVPTDPTPTTTATSSSTATPTTTSSATSTSSSSTSPSGGASATSAGTTPTSAPTTTPTTPGPGTEELPETGSSQTLAWLGAGGLVLVLTGVGAVLVPRRRLRRH